MTGVSVQCVRVYKLAVDNACEAADASVLTLQGLEDKARELLEEMKTMDELARQMFVMTFIETVVIMFIGHFTLFFFSSQCIIERSCMCVRSPCVACSTAVMIHKYKHNPQVLVQHKRNKQRTNSVVIVLQ